MTKSDYKKDCSDIIEEKYQMSDACWHQNNCTVEVDLNDLGVGSDCFLDFDQNGNRAVSTFVICEGK